MRSVFRRMRHSGRTALRLQIVVMAHTVVFAALCGGQTIGEITNPSYEDATDFLAGWSSCLAGESSIKHNPDRYLPDPRFHDGSNSAGMCSDRPGDALSAGAIFQEIDVTPGRSYHIHCWGTLTDETGYQDDFLELRIRDGDSAPINCDNDGDEIVNNSTVCAHLDGQEQVIWTLLEGEITPAQPTITIIAYWTFAGTAWGVKALHLDDWNIDDVTPSAVQFSNFERTRVMNGSAYDIMITYDTALATTTQIEWGSTPAYGLSSPFDPLEITHHTVQLNSVAPSTGLYHYRARATASGGIDEYSSDQLFDAPLIEFSNVETAIDPFSGIVCTVSWNTNFSTAENRVLYRETGTGSFAEACDPSDPLPRHSHSVAISGLSLGTTYEFYLTSGADDIITAVSPIDTFTMPAQPGPSAQIGMAMIGGSIPDGGDDVGPANEVQDMIERDHPMVTFSGMASTTWRVAQPTDPGDGPNVYDWSSLDASAQKRIPGKALRGYQQIWGCYPDWAELDTTRFWEKYEQFVEAMTVHINNEYGPVYYVFENEPNISRAPDGWNWADWYVHCLQHFHAAVHAANTQSGLDNKVIAGNLCGHSASAFNDLYARGLKDCSDILGYHPYPYDIRDGLDVYDLAMIHSIQVDYEDAGKKIFVSEGWGSGRSAGFDRSSPAIEPIAQEVENMYLAMVNGWDNVMTPMENWHPDYLWGMSFFCGNDNWGAMNHRARAIPDYDEDGDIVAFWLDGYHKGTDIAPYFWNGGMMDFYGNSKDCLIHMFPGNGLVFMNPGFELASDPPDAHLAHFWTPDTNPAAEANYALDDTVFRGGSRALRLTRTTAGTNSVHQTTAKRSVIPGVSYRARVWCKTQNQQGLIASFYLRFWDAARSTSSDKTWAPDLTGTTSGWQQMEIIATAPSFASSMEVGCKISGGGTVWFDDVTIAMTCQQEFGIARGYTLDEGQVPVPNCLVRTTTGGFQAVSDANGYYEIPNLPIGTYDFVCRQAGYVPHRVRNQTIAAGKLTFVSFNMSIPTPGLTITQIACEPGAIAPGGNSTTVAVTVANAKPYPNAISEVSPFVEQNGADVSEMFTIKAAENNPVIIPENEEAIFEFLLAAKPETPTGSFEVNAYAFGQEDRPNMLENGGFDDEPWGNHWTFTGGAETLTWETDSTNYVSPPRSLKCYVSDNDYTYNWANNWSAYAAGSTPAKPAQSYTVGVQHRDELSDGVRVDLFIQEYYYDGIRWYYNGRRFAAVPHRSVWAHDVMIYETGDPNVTQGLYTTNRLVISCGPCTTPTAGSGYNWWDDLYVKETGDWLADDRADSGATIDVTPAPLIELSTAQIHASTMVGRNPASQTFTVRNVGDGTLHYSIAADAEWVSVDPDQGTSDGEADVITVTYDVIGLVADTYDGLITITDPAAANTPQIISVRLTIDSLQPDFDGDGDVDQDDFGRFQTCLTGPGVPQNITTCLDARLDRDEDVDQNDASLFLDCMSGANVLADLDCLD